MLHTMHRITQSCTSGIRSVLCVSLFYMDNHTLNCGLNSGELYHDMTVIYKKAVGCYKKWYESVAACGKTYKWVIN